MKEGSIEELKCNEEVTEISLFIYSHEARMRERAIN
jgi:hypothetical protein